MKFFLNRFYNPFIIGLLFCLTVLGMTRQTVTATAVSIPAPTAAEEPKPNPLAGIQAKTKEFRSKLAELASAFSAVENELTAQQNRTPIEVSNESDLDALKSQQARLTEALRTAQNQLQRIDGEERFRNERLHSIPDELAMLQSGAPPEDISASRLKEHDAKVELLTQEQRYYTESRSLIEIQKKAALIDQQVTKDDLDTVEARIQVLEGNEDNETAARITATLAIPNLPYDVRDLGNRLLGLITARKPGGRLATYADEVKAQSRDLEAFQESLDTMEESGRTKVSLLHQADLPLDDSTGSLLRRQRESLPSNRAMKRKLLEGTARAADLQMLALDLGTEQSKLLQPDFESDLLEVAGSDFSEIVLKIVPSYREEVGISLAEARDLAAKQSSLNKVQNELNKRARAFATFIEEQILWVRNLKPLHQTIGEEARSAFFSLVDPDLWGSVVVALGKDFLRIPLVWILIGLFLLIIGIRVKRWLGMLQQCGKLASRYGCTDLTDTWRSLAITSMLALSLPLVLAFVGFRLFMGEETRGIGVGLVHAAAILALGSFFYLGSRKEGLLTHFKLSPEGLGRLHRTLMWATPLMCLFGGTTSLLVAHIPQCSCGRFFFLAELIIFSVFAIRLLPCSAGLVKKRYLSRVSLVFVILSSLGIGIFAYLGYYESALSLRPRIFFSLCVVALLLFTRGMFTRSLTTADRRELRAQLLRKREARKAEGVEPAIPTEEVLEAEQIRLFELSAQTQAVIQFVSTASMIALLILIWIDHIPAVASLDKKVVWHGSSSQVESGSTEFSGRADSVTALETDSDSDAQDVNGLTLLDLLLAIVVLVVTLLLARSLPALIEILFLRRFFKRAPGASYASTTMIRYALLFGGILLFLRLVKFDWASIQWIAAAATLGIGFGLQEIFGNFVSGLILLVERPVRLGDLVTIGSNSGKVSSIRMRATTITQFNNRELVIPNKMLVTGNLINWTLTDPTMRLEISIGVAYGSDTRRVKEILFDVAKSQPLVLETPAPVVLFTEFADSSLNFILRYYVTTTKDYVDLSSEMHFEIDRRFREENIDIPFPQRTVHLTEPKIHTVQNPLE